MATTTSLLDTRSFHIISYGTFVGTTFFQSFIAGPVAFKALPRALFGKLQESATPIFFALQTALATAVILTYPGERTIGVGERAYHAHSGLSGVLHEANIWTVAVPTLVMLVTSAINLAVLGPATTKTMKDRHRQESQDGKKSYDAGPHSSEMAALNKRFSILHSVSSVLDLAGYLASLYYGYVLGARL